MNRNRQSRYATGIVQEGIARQISMLEPGDDSALSSSDDIGVHAKQTLEALRTAELLLAPNTSASRAFLRHFPDSDARPLFTEKLATEKLQNIGTYVQRIHLASIMSSRSVDALMDDRICDYFDRITECLGLLIRRLHRYLNAGSNSPAVLHALEDFVRSANQWIGPAVFILNEDL
ncbi:hypothetical protein BS47DRAFT_739947 [Hydnum rufescens UP504]|uniref:Uncharacterized protein n=1 Tax=Hydnum rufescens UP504 TaxID=1448309 RepID=A0A9P6B100_9AGAM|nr:hypothetical protein BS47DRAFT_739947 [Hydnum rufescens UP504]